MDERPALQLPDITPRAIAAADEITFIGTATTLIKVAGFSILTDPNFLQRGDRAYVGMGLSTKRLTEPALSIQQLPELDFIVLSHHHGDHFHLGGTRTAGILLTMDARQGVEALRIIAPREAIPSTTTTTPCSSRRCRNSARRPRTLGSAPSCITWTGAQATGSVSACPAAEKSPGRQEVYSWGSRSRSGR